MVLLSTVLLSTVLLGAVLEIEHHLLQLTTIHQVRRVESTEIWSNDILLSGPQNLTVEGGTRINGSSELSVVGGI